MSKIENVRIESTSITMADKGKEGNGMSGLHIDGIGWNALGVWCGECGAATCEGCKYEYRPFQGFNEKVIAEFKRAQEEE